MEGTPPQESNIPLLITREMQQALADLGYNKSARYTMTPAEAQEILKGQKLFAKKEENSSPQNGWDLVHMRWEHAVDALEEPLTAQTDEILHLTAVELNPDKIYAYLRTKESSLTPAQKEFLQASIAVKTKAREGRE